MTVTVAVEAQKVSANEAVKSAPSVISRKKRLAFVLILWCALLGFAEAAARAYIPLRGYTIDQIRQIFNRRSQQRLTGNWSKQDRNHPYLPFVLQTRPPDVEMRGLRLTSKKEVKPPDVFRLFLMGGSTAMYIDPAKIERALEQDFALWGLRLEVVNAANISWTTVESVVNFATRCVHYAPDTVVVYHAVNDAWPAFGEDWRPDYLHFRKRLVRNEPVPWDYLPRFWDHSAAFVQIRAWIEGRHEAYSGVDALMHYIPDFENDPYHRVAPFRENLLNLIGLARIRRIPVLLSTQVCNVKAGPPRLVAAVHECNEITRSLVDETNGVYLVDADALIDGNDSIMKDICHFRPETDGENQLVAVLAGAVRTHLEDWLSLRRIALTQIRD